MLMKGQTIFRWALMATLGAFAFAPAAFAQQPAATIDFTDSILNGGGVLPLSRWIPLMRIEMGHAADDMNAPRALTELRIQFKNDPAPSRSYDRFSSSESALVAQIRDFAIFREHEPTNEGSFSTVLDADDLRDGDLVAQWTPFDTVLDVSGPGDLFFDLRFPPLDSCLPLPENNVNAIHNLGSAQFSNSYILAFRSTDLWVSGQTLAYEVPIGGAVALDCFGTFPFDMNGVLDQYSPDFYGDSPEDFDPGTALASSFGVLDITGSVNETRNDPLISQSWNWPTKLYTPLAEYRRPRFDVGSGVFDFVTGEWLELRRLMSTDNWYALMGIDAHSVPAVESIEISGTEFFLGNAPSPATLMEVNLILTDVGADPMGLPGNGGFNPRTMLETSTDSVYATPSGIPAGTVGSGPDFTFNGAWVFADSNGNSLFDPPIPGNNGGLSITDRALFPIELFPEVLVTGGPPVVPVNPGVAKWEYIPFPPGGGDPWWKIRLRFNNGARRNIAAADDDPPTGHLEPVPDDLGVTVQTGETFDFFVVVRPDAGFFDAQISPGDGVGMTLGADFRAFIEPQRVNPTTGFMDGGIFIDSQDPSRGAYDANGQPVLVPWQEDSDYTPGEPWWDQRSMNQSVARINKSGVEVHDLVMTYESNNAFAKDTFLDFRDGSINAPGYVGGSNWADWFDPFGIISSQFNLFVHNPGVDRIALATTGSVDDNRLDLFHYPYETAGFFDPVFDGTGPFAPRSNFFPFPPPQPTLPDYMTWPGLPGGVSDPGGGFFIGLTPQEQQWPAGNRRARLLRQRIDTESPATAMLGINLAGTDDPVANAENGIFLERLTVALWGPGFNPHAHLQPVDPTGASGLSGIALYEDASGDGVFGADFRLLGPGSVVPDATSVDDPVTLQSAAFRPNPEPVDLDGDGAPDDLSGDGTYQPGIDDAWVIRLTPSAPWPFPVRDGAGGFVGGVPRAASAEGELQDASQEEQVPRPRGKEYWTATPTTVTPDDVIAAPKAIGPSGNSGDDLFFVVRTSDRIPRGLLFRAFVPAGLPSRPSFDRVAGVEVTPQAQISASAYRKAHPEEGPPERYYGVGPFGVDMIEANVGVKLDASVAPDDVFADSGNVPVMKIDVSTNRGDISAIADSSTLTPTAGTGAPGSFVVPGAGWTPAAFTNFFLIDSTYESFEITGNTSDTLFLRTSGNAADAPVSGAWIIVRGPSFFEQLVVEFYDEGNDGGFDLLEDLLPLSIDPSVSGVKLYRDNDFNPGNVNGEFDPGDIPVPLDFPPYQIGQSGEPSFQVLFDFSSPGTDDIGPGGSAATLASQFPHNRQWVPESFGISPSDPNFGADFFLVIATSDRIQIGDDFRVGIVSWGANTDTLPDPNTFPPPPTSTVGEFDVFSEFPWGSRALGFITFAYGGSPLYKAYPEVDISGFNWVRSSVSRAVQTSTITTVERVVQPDDLVINTVSPVLLTKITAAGGVTLSIAGVNFGASPNVTLDAVPLPVTASTDTTISAVIPGGTTIDLDNDGVVVLRVTDPATAKTDTFSGFSIINANPADTPTIISVNPNSGGSGVFPVTITGTNFDNPTVTFGSTVMPVASVTPTTIVVNFPVGGLPQTGLLDVTVVNFNGLFVTATDAFNYINSPSGGGGGGGGGFGGGGGLPTVGCFIATAAYDGGHERELTALRAFRDDVLLKSALGAAVVDAYYSASPPIADAVAERPWLAAGVRAMLTPVARTVEQPAWLLLPAGMLAAGFVAARTRRRKARSR